MDIVVVKSFDNYFTANIYLAKLQGSGIECYLKDEYTVTIDPLLTNAIGGIKLVVKREDAEKALQLIQQSDEEYLRSIKCPRCGASDFTYVAKPNVGNIITRVLAWMFASKAIAPDYVYKCGNCGYETETLPDPIPEE